MRPEQHPTRRYVCARIPWDCRARAESVPKRAWPDRPETARYPAVQHAYSTHAGTAPYELPHTRGTTGTTEWTYGSMKSAWCSIRAALRCDAIIGRDSRYSALSVKPANTARGAPG